MEWGRESGGSMAGGNFEHPMSGRHYSIAVKSSTFGL